MAKQKPHKCVKCNEPLNNFAAYIPGEGEACLKCYTAYAQSKEILPLIPPKEMEK
jgi:recombinational DNA repair protein (RecF pathway)